MKIPLDAEDLTYAWGLVKSTWRGRPGVALTRLDDGDILVEIGAVSCVLVARYGCERIKSRDDVLRGFWLAPGDATAPRAGVRRTANARWRGPRIHHKPAV